MLKNIFNKLRNIKPPADTGLDNTEDIHADNNNAGERYTTRQVKADDIVYNTDLDRDIDDIAKDLTPVATYVVDVDGVLAKNEAGVSAQRILRGGVTAYVHGGLIQPYAGQSDDALIQAAEHGRYAYGDMISEFEDMTLITDAIDFELDRGALLVYLDDEAYDIERQHIGWITDADIINKYKDPDYIMADIGLILTGGKHKRIDFKTYGDIDGEFAVETGRQKTIDVQLTITFEVI